jgi:hypothetical protein
VLSLIRPVLWPLSLPLSLVLDMSLLTHLHSDALTQAQVSSFDILAISLFGLYRLSAQVQSDGILPYFQPCLHFRITTLCQSGTVHRMFVYQYSKLIKATVYEYRA